MSAPYPSNESKRIEALRRYEILDTPPEQAFTDFALLASTICKTPIAFMNLIDTDRQWCKAAFGLPAAETPREHAFCAYTILGQDVLIVDDATKDERFAENPLVKAAPKIRFYAGAPLIDKEGYALGSLCVIDRKVKHLDSVQMKSLQALARQIISQLEFRRAASDLAAALLEIKALQGLLPICCHCKEIRDDTGYWESVDSYIAAHSDVKFSHGICPECVKKYYPDVYEEWNATEKI
jgi:GAF domain-containing protein